MSDMTFAHTLLRTDYGTFRAGDVIRNTEGEYPWCQCILLGFSAPDKHGDVYVKLSRPYAYVSCAGTTSPTVLTGVETLTMPISKLKHEKVLTCGGEAPMVAGSIGHTRPGEFESECIDLRTDPDTFPCPGCDCKPGEGRTPGCTHPDGCGYQG